MQRFKVYLMHNLLEFLTKYYHWFIFILLECISVSMIFSYNSYQNSSWVTSANVVSGKVYEVNSNVEQFFSLVKNNEKLTQRNLYLEQQVKMLSEQLTKQTGDSTFMNMAEVKMLEHYNVMPAKVVSNSIADGNNLITIDKGEADGVHRDMGVASGTGVVGIVYQTTQHYSVVIPLLNERSNISCKIDGRGYFGSLKWLGKDSRYAFLDDIPRHAHFKLYDKVVTSGYSSVFPEGVQVGRILHVYNSPDGVSYRCMVELSTDFSRLRDVCVIDDKMMNERLEVIRAARDSLTTNK